MWILFRILSLILMQYWQLRHKTLNLSFCPLEMDNSVHDVCSGLAHVQSLGTLTSGRRQTRNFCITVLTCLISFQLRLTEWVCVCMCCFWLSIIAIMLTVVYCSNWVVQFLMIGVLFHCTINCLQFSWSGQESNKLISHRIKLWHIRTRVLIYIISRRKRLNDRSDLCVETIELWYSHSLIHLMTQHGFYLLS